MSIMSFSGADPEIEKFLYNIFTKLIMYKLEKPVSK